MNIEVVNFWGTVLSCTDRIREASFTSSRVTEVTELKILKAVRQQNVVKLQVVVTEALGEPEVHARLVESPAQGVLGIN